MDDFNSLQGKYFAKTEEKQFKWLTENPYISQKERQLLSEIMRIRPKKILEIGCGEGANLVNLRRIGFRGEMVGFDFSPKKIAFAQQNVLEARFLVADANNLPFEKEQFDLVFCKNLLHHLKNQSLVISEMARVCKKGGEVVIIEGNGRNLLIYCMGVLIPAEKGLMRSTKTNLETLVNEEKTLRIKMIKMIEPFNFFRALFNYRFGLSSLVGDGKFWLKTEAILGKFIPRNQFGYIMIIAAKN